ncbi:MAG: hypothetical protein AAF399_06310 [Bacteroidota bacterium]
MKQLLILLLVICWSHLLPAQEEEGYEYVRKILFNAPEDLPQDTLLIARFDMLDPEDGARGPKRDYIVQVNRAAKKGNTTLNEQVLKAYPFPYKLISLSEVEWYREQGYRYFMDMSLMPKQLRQPKPEALVPCWFKFESANKMYNNRNAMWHYYFYIRDLQSGDAYMTSNMRGQGEVYVGIRKFLNQVRRDVEGK